VTAVELPGGRGMLTDDSGIFDLTELPAGRYTLTVSKSGFVSLSYGQRRPLQAGTPLQLADGQTLKGIEFQLPRGSVIGGRGFGGPGGPGGGPGGFGGRGGRGGGANAAFATGTDQEQINYAPTYYPGVPSVNEAKPVAVGLSQEVLDINFNMQLVRVARIAGH